jgi:predicted acylesterase/phospholipase RssA
VARALREASIPIDGIIGTSAGALVGGVMAVIDDLDDAQHRMVEWFESARWRRDFNPPTVALTSGRMISHALQRFSGNTLIENLPIEFAAVSCDLVTARPFVHDRGLLWQAVRASASVPGVFPPIGLDGRLLVDGGLVDNLPAQVARERHPHARIIAVDVGDPSDVDVGDIDGSGIVNGWERVRRPGRSGGASLARVMMRLTELGRHDAADVADLADVIIRPDVRGFGLIETKRAREIVARGYAAGRAAVESGLA